MSSEKAEKLYFCWPRWARRQQRQPPGDWTTWLLMGGRGSGKTRAGSEWIRRLARRKISPIALVGETMTEAIDIMVRGESGLIAVHADHERPTLKGNHRLVWPNGVEATILTASDPERFRGPQFAAAWCDELGCAAVDKGANQPNIFGDPKSAESGRPYFSAGTPDLLMQRQFLRAHHRHWADETRNPVGMVDAERIYCWTWDARPYPAFPARDDVWADGANHGSGHWLTGRLGAAASDELLGAVAADHGCEIVADADGPLVGGFALSGPARARDAIEPILEITGQRLVARDGVLSVVSPKRGGGTELAGEALARIDAPVISRRRTAAAERPARLALGHIDRTRDYLSATATALRPGIGPLVSESVSMVLDGAGARLAAERLLDARGAAGDTVELAVPPTMLGLEPGDRISVAELAEGPFEITEIRDGLVRRITARGLPAGDAVATGVDRPAAVASVAGLAVPPDVVLAHLPPVAGDAAGGRLVIGAYANPWPGRVRIADAVTGASLVDLMRPAALGEVVSGIGIGPGGVWDRGSALEIQLRGGHLADGAEAAVLAGSNRLAVETGAGTWEVIGFAKAELVATGRYVLRTLLRGLEGSAIGTIAADARVMVLDGKVASLPVDLVRLGEPQALKVYAGAADLVGQDLVVMPQVAAALPLAPVHLRARVESSGDIAFSWTRRSRADGDGWGAVGPPLDAAPERYLLEIFEGAVLKRSLDCLAAEASYGLADQVSDFGGAATGFTWRVAQVSAVLGPGRWQRGLLVAEDRFEACLTEVLRHEGGYVDHPSDPGGATNMGITHKTLARWRRVSPRSALPKAEVAALSRAEAGAIYRAQYWNASRAGDLPRGLDLALFDFAVNSGADRAVRMLQAVLGVAADGVIGPVTLAAVSGADVKAAINGLCDRRLGFLGRLKTFVTFGRGWTRRVADVRAAALAAAKTTSTMQRRTAMDILSGYRTYIVAAFMLLAGLMQVLGIDLPSLDGGAAGSLILEALAVIFLRKGMKGAE